MTEELKVASVISIVEYRNSDTVATLQRLLEKAKAGEVTGLAYAAQLGTKNHSVGVTGTYREDPLSGISPVGQLFDTLRKAF